MVVPPGGPVALDCEPGETVEAALGGGVLRPVDGPLAAPDSGKHWLAVASRDAAGNRSPVRWVRLEVDGDGPELLLKVHPKPVESRRDRLWVPPSATIRLVAMDAGAGLAELGIRAFDPLDPRTPPQQAIHRPEAPSSKQATPVELILPATVRGFLRIEAWAEDAAGNRSQETIEGLWIGEGESGS